MSAASATSDKTSKMEEERAKARSRRATFGTGLLGFAAAYGGYIGLKAGKFETWPWFAWHPLAMLLGFVGVGSFAVLTKKIKGKQEAILHGYLLFLSSALASFGAYVIYSNKEMYKKQHLQTPPLLGRRRGACRLCGVPRWRVDRVQPGQRHFPNQHDAAQAAPIQRPTRTRSGLAGMRPGLCEHEQGRPARHWHVRHPTFLWAAAWYSSKSLTLKL